MPDIIDVPDDVTEEELEAKILAILETESRNTGKVVRKIMDNESEEC